MFDIFFDLAVHFLGFHLFVSGAFGIKGSGDASHPMSVVALQKFPVMSPQANFLTPQLLPSAMKLGNIALKGILS